MQNITKMASHRFQLAECFDPSFPTGVFFFLLCYRRVISHIVWLVVLTESRNSFSSSSFCGTKKNVNSHVFFLRAFTQVASRNAPVGSAPDLAPNEDVDGPSTSLLNYFNKVMTCLAISYQHLYFSYWHR